MWQDDCVLCNITTFCHTCVLIAKNFEIVNMKWEWRTKNFHFVFQMEHYVP